MEELIFTNEEISSFLCKKLEIRHSKKVYLIEMLIDKEEISLEYNLEKDSAVSHVDILDTKEIIKEMRKAMPKVKIAAKKKEDKKVVTTSPVNLESTVNKMGKVVTQIIHFNRGNKRTVEGVLSDTIKEGSFTKFMVKKGYMVMVRTENVDMIEVFTEE